MTESETTSRKKSVERYALHIETHRTFISTNLAWPIQAISRPCPRALGMAFANFEAFADFDQVTIWICNVDLPCSVGPGLGAGGNRNML